MPLLRRTEPSIDTTRGSGDTWSSTARHKLGVRRRAWVQTASTAFRIVLGLLTLALLVYVAVEVYDLRREAAERQHVRPPTTRRFQASETMPRGTVVSFLGDSRVGRAPEAVGSLVASQLGMEPSAPPTIAAPTAEAGDVAAGFRLRMDTASVVAQLVYYQLPLTSSSGLSTAPTLAETPIDTEVATATSVAGVLAGGVWPTAAVGLTWHRNGTGADGVVVASVRTSSMGAFVSVVVSTITVAMEANLLTGSVGGSGADPAFVSPFGERAVVVGYPCSGGCCVRMVRPASRETGPALLLPRQDGGCPSTARVALFDAGSPTISIGVRPNVLLLQQGTSGSNTLQISQRFSVGEGINAIPQAVDLAQGSTDSVFRGFLVVAPTPGAVRVRLLRYDTATRRFVDEQQGITIRTSTMTAMEVDAATVVHWNLHALIVLRDDTDACFLVATDLNVLGSSSELVPLRGLSGLRLHSLVPSRHGELVLGTATDASEGRPATAAAVALAWHGGLHVAGVAAAGVEAGGLFDVVVDGTLGGLHGLVGGQAYAAGPSGALALATTAPLSTTVVGVAVSQTELDVVLALARV